MPSRASTAAALSRKARRCTRRGRVPSSASIVMFSATLICGNNARSCQITSMPKRRACKGETVSTVVPKYAMRSAESGR